MSLYLLQYFFILMSHLLGLLLNVEEAWGFQINKNSNKKNKQHCFFFPVIFFIITFILSHVLRDWCTVGQIPVKV